MLYESYGLYVFRLLYELFVLSASCLLFELYALYVLYVLLSCICSMRCMCCICFM